MVQQSLRSKINQVRFRLIRAREAYDRYLEAVAALTADNDPDYLGPDPAQCRQLAQQFEKFRADLAAEQARLEDLLRDGE